MGLLAPDVTLTADGGGVASSARRPVVGADRVARFLVGLWRKAPADVEVRLAVVNGMPAVAGLTEGRPDTVLAVDVDGGRVTAVRAIRNPEELASLRLRPR